MDPENIQQTIQAVLDGLTPLAQKLQIPLEGLWGWAMKANYAYACIDVYILIVGIIVFIPSLKFVIKKGLFGDDGDPNPVAIVSVIGSLIGVAILIGGIIAFGHAIFRIFAPEYSTAMLIINLVN